MFFMSNFEFKLDSSAKRKLNPYAVNKFWYLEVFYKKEKNIYVEHDKKALKNMVKQKLTTKTKQNKTFFLTSELTCSSLDENVCRQKGMYGKERINRHSI